MLVHSWDSLTMSKNCQKGEGIGSKSCPPKWRHFDTILKYTILWFNQRFWNQVNSFLSDFFWIPISLYGIDHSCCLNFTHDMQFLGIGPLPTTKFFWRRKKNGTQKMYSIIVTVLVAQFKIVVHRTFNQHFNEYHLYKKLEMVWKENFAIISWYHFSGVST